jgi:enterochelin esterase-like enzyme
VRYPAPESTNPAGVHDMLVYTPKGYDPNRAEPYPTLYLSHGSGDHSTAWFMQGVAHYIVQNAINEGVVPEMVVVSTDFNGLPGGNNGYSNHLRNTVIPYMEAHYNVSTRSEDRAFAGFSAGGARACTNLYDHTDLFGYHAVWSAACGPANAAQLERVLSVPGGIMIGTGRQDRTTTFGPIEARANALKAAGVELVEYYMDGMHTWHVWRPLLNFYIRNIAFRTTTTDLAVEATRAGNSHNVRITATATVDTVSSSVAPVSGTVEFYAGENLLGTAQIKTNGPAAGTATLRGAFNESLLTGPIVAKYVGNDVLNGSDSSPVTATF